MNSHFTYFLILAGSLAGPLLLSFDKKVAFYKKWKYLFPAMLLPAAFYIVWDIFFTAKGVWSFNPLYITGSKLVNLPVEEVLFFFVVPYCCIFIYECIRVYFPAASRLQWGPLALLVLALPLLLTGILFYNRYYTASTFLLTALALLLLYAFRKQLSFFNPALFIVSYAVILIPFLIVNGFLTAIPVVLYNDAENLGLRIYTIPFEDAFYGMLLIVLNVLIYERLQKK